MPTFNEFIANFGWTEFWVVTVIIVAIVGIRERHYFLKAGPDRANLKSVE